MSATGFHPEPSAKAPWTRTIVLTAAYAGDDAARAAPVKRAKIKRFMVHPPLMFIAINWCAPQLELIFDDRIPYSPPQNCAMQKRKEITEGKNHVANEISEGLDVGYRLCSGHIHRVSHYLLAHGIPHSLHGPASHACWNIVGGDFDGFRLQGYTR